MPPRININWVRHGEKTRWSNFWLMINTNRAESNETERSYVVETLRNAVNKVFNDQTNIESVINVINEKGEVETDLAVRQIGLRTIETIETEAVVEIGTKQHRIHSHVLVMIQHHSRLQLNIPALRDMIREFSKVNGRTPMFPNPAVKLRWIKENPMNAIKKYQRGYKNLPSGLTKKVMEK